MTQFNPFGRIKALIGAVDPDRSKTQRDLDAEALALYHEKYDPQANIDTTPSDNELVKLHSIWGVEFYTPNQIDQLASSFEKLGWDQNRTRGLGRDPRVWLERSKRSNTGGGISNLGVLTRRNDRRFHSSIARLAPLPPNVDFAEATMVSVTSSLISIVVEFTFDATIKLAFDDALRKKRVTYAKPFAGGTTYHDVQSQKRDAIYRIRVEIDESVSEWFATNLPGLFASGLLGGAVPTCEYVTTQEAQPFPSVSDRSSFIRYLSPLGLHSDFGTWNSRRVGGLKFSMSGFTDDKLRNHSVLAVNESHHDDAKPHQFDSAQLLTLLSMLPMLDGYTQHLMKVRETPTFKVSRSRRISYVIERLGQHVAFSSDINAVASDLVTDSTAWMLLLGSANEFQSSKLENISTVTKLGNVLRSNIRDRANWILRSDRAIRDHMTQYGTLIGASENVKIQSRIEMFSRVVVILTVVTLILTLVTLDFVDWLSRIPDWLMELDFWKRLPWVK